MMSDGVPFAEWRAMLESLGFQALRQPTHWLFEHPEPDTLMICRLYQPRDFVREHDLAASRTLLDERGLMAADAFDRFLSSKTSA